MKPGFRYSLFAAAATALILQAHGQAGGDIDFGDDSSLWAEDGECDDPRFEGDGMSSSTDAADIGSDATDCRNAFLAGSITLAAAPSSKKPLLNKMPTRSTAGSPSEAEAIDYGDDASLWANDGECDDARFIGTGVTETGFVEDDIGHDASDCRAAVEAGSARLRAEGDPPMESVVDDYDLDEVLEALKALEEFDAADPADFDEPPADGIMFNGVNFGDNASEWANDDECDDPRFVGEGMTETSLLAADAYHDANDCLASWKAGNLQLADD